jgi:predicted alpha-1,2-mannosidase
MVVRRTTTLGALVLALLFLSAFRGCLDERVGRDLPPGAGPTALWAYVDTRVGTGGAFWMAAQNAPAAQVPFGRVRLGPDTATFGRIFGTAGYHYDDTAILGFSHTRLVGTGVYEGGALRVMPAEEPIAPNELERHFLPFAHSREEATPGYYRVESVRRGVQAELTATERVGYHRYTFRRSATPRLYLDLASHLANDGAVRDLSGSVDLGTRLVTGSFRLFDDFSKRYGGLPTFFAARLPVETANVRWLAEAPVTAATLSRPTGPLRLEVTLAAPAGTPVVLTVALSHVSVAGALRALEVETNAGAKSFDDARDEARALWQSALERLRVEGPSEPDAHRKLYTALVRAFSMPTRFDDPPLPGDADGRYLAFDGTTPFATGFAYYTDFSLWDTFRTAHPLYALLWPNRQRDFVRSILAMAEASGRLPRWAAGSGHADSMFGAPAVIVLADTAAKDPAGFDVADAYAKSVSALTPSGAKGQECLAEKIRLGYCAADSIAGSVSRTLDWAWAELAASRLAAQQGDAAGAAAFEARARSYRSLWHPERKAFVPRRRDARFLDDWSLLDSGYVPITASGKHYVEGTANHWRWSPFLDHEGVRALFGDAFFPELETFFAKTSPVLGAAYPTGYYWHGNEHDLHAAFLFALAGRNDRTDAVVASLRQTKYRMSSVGLDGNDDGGTLSAWYVLAATGLYPIAGSDRYVLAAPAFSRLTIDRGNGAPLIVVEHDRATGPYACGASWNGAPLATPTIDHGTLAGGGTLRFVASAKPCRWGSR